MSSVLRSRSRRLLAPLVLAAGLILAGCAEPGQVRDFNETVQANFIDACLAANEARGDDAEELCTCWWDAVVEEYTFDEFRSLDRELRDQISEGLLTSPADLQRLQPRFAEVVASCQVQGPQAPA